MREIRYTLADALLVDLTEQVGAAPIAEGVRATRKQIGKIDADRMIDVILDTLAAEVPEIAQIMDRVKRGAFPVPK